MRCPLMAPSDIGTVQMGARDPSTDFARIRQLFVVVRRRWSTRAHAQRQGRTVGGRRGCLDLAVRGAPRQDDPVSSDAAHPNDYSNASIKIVSFAESVRTRPQMYFGRAREDPALVTAVARAVVADAMY